MYETRTHAPIPRPHFVRRMLLHFLAATALVIGSLGVGMAGYAVYEGLGWCDSFLNAAMLLGGMGPVETPQTVGGKLFAGCYALYAGLVFLVATGLLLIPVFHRVLHKFHWESAGDK